MSTATLSAFGPRQGGRRLGLRQIVVRARSEDARLDLRGWSLAAVDREIARPIRRDPIQWNPTSAGPDPSGPIHQGPIHQAGLEACGILT